MSVRDSRSSAPTADRAKPGPEGVEERMARLCRLTKGEDFVPRTMEVVVVNEVGYASPKSLESAVKNQTSITRFFTQIEGAYPPAFRWNPEFVREALGDGGPPPPAPESASQRLERLKGEYDTVAAERRRAEEVWLQGDLDMKGRLTTLETQIAQAARAAREERLKEARDAFDKLSPEDKITFLDEAMSPPPPPTGEPATVTEQPPPQPAALS